MTHPLSPLVRAVIEKAANAAESAIVNVCRKDPMPTAGRVMEAIDAAIRALDADKIAADNAHLVPGVAEVERLRAYLDTLPDGEVGPHVIDTICGLAHGRKDICAAQQGTSHDR